MANKLFAVSLGDTAKLNKDSITLQTISSSFENIRLLGTKSSGAIKKVYLLTATTLTANDTNYWEFFLINKGQDGSGTTKIIDNATLVNTTKATGGSGTTGYVVREFTISSSNTFNKNDVLVFGATKNGSASNLNSSTIYIEWQG